MMHKLLVLLPLICIFTVFAEDTQNVNLLDLDDNKFVWDGFNLGPTILSVSAEHFTILVTIDSCNIGDPNSRPNEQYLIIKEGTTGKDGRVFAYIKQSKTLYFFSGSVILELKTDKPLTETCKVIFEKADVEDTTLPPPTTSEIIPTSDGEVSKYSTVLISGRSIYDFNKNKTLVLELEKNLVQMALAYTTTEGFCLKENITTKNIEIYALEQCSAKLPNSERCVRLVYAMPIKIDDECSLWKGYQLTEQHLNIMWTRLANQYLKNGFEEYKEPSINKVMLWWLIKTVVASLVFVIVIFLLSLAWKKHQLLKRAKAHQNEDYMPDIRRVSDMSLTPQYFQSIPPMFDKTYKSNAQFAEGINGTENEGFQYDEILNCEEDGTTI